MIQDLQMIEEKDNLLNVWYTEFMFCKIEEVTVEVKVGNIY